MSTPALERAKNQLGNAWTDEQAETTAYDAVSAALREPGNPDWLTFVLHDADCPDRTCEPGTMGRYRRQARALRREILGEA